MSRDEQAGMYLRVRDEYNEAVGEMGGLTTSLRLIGEGMVSEGKKLISDPSESSMDGEAVCADIRRAVREMKRYKDLEAIKADRRKELEGYGEAFPPLES